ncbi:uncharacterized protein LOC141674185 [Apium graveolens]|uniref:uncharacterized protein LOC141674185 n=1 Tax=Apium graveolens TaxID=4045 RepID=UPI003D7A7634
MTFKAFQNVNPPYFYDTTDPVVANTWIREMERSFEFVRLGEDRKTVYSTYFLKGGVIYWWNSVKALEEVQPVTWARFKELFLEKYYPKYVQKQMEMKFLDLKQGNMTVLEYVKNFTELSRFVTKYVGVVQKAALIKSNGVQSRKESDNKKRKVFHYGGKANKLLRKGYEAFLAYVVNTENEVPSKEEILVVKEFPDVFLEELRGLPPDRHIEFEINLAPGAEPVSKAPYRMAPTKMKELASQLQEILDKGVIRIATPLTKLTRKNQKFKWNTECEGSFQELKQKFVTAPVLVLPDDKGGFVIYSNASHKGLGCVLMQHNKVTTNREEFSSVSDLAQSHPDNTKRKAVDNTVYVRKQSKLQYPNKGYNTQELFSQCEDITIHAPATQEPPA